MHIFDIDNPVWSTFSKIMDIIILNILFLIGCIPIITISTSFTAMYYTGMRIVSGDVVYVSKDFWNSYKTNFKQAFLTGVIVFDVGVILAVATYMTFYRESYVGKVLCVVLDVYYLGVVSYIFPLLAKFKTTVSTLFRNSMLMAIAHIPFTILNIGTFFIAGLTVYMYIGCLFIWAVGGIAALIVLQSLWFNYIFAKYMNQEDLELSDLYREEEKMAKQEKKTQDMRE